MVTYTIQPLYGLCYHILRSYFKSSIYTPCSMVRHKYLANCYEIPLAFQSTTPVWDATWDLCGSLLARFISIHAPRMGCDMPPCFTCPKVVNFNPRTPYGMRHMKILPISLHSYFNPRTPYGMRLKGSLHAYFLIDISIHAPRMGCDRISISALSLLTSFQSTHPVWDATCRCNYRLIDSTNFNPRTPYGMRHDNTYTTGTYMGFQSTHPVWDATRRVAVSLVMYFISIHAPRMGCDDGGLRN